MIIVVLGTACVSPGSLCGICDFIRGLNFRSEVGLRSGKHVLQAAVELCLQSPSTSGTETSREKTKRRRRRDAQEPKRWLMWLPAATNPHVFFSYHIQALTILFSNCMRPPEAHEALPQSCNLSCSRLMRVAGCCWAEWGGSASARLIRHVLRTRAVRSSLKSPTGSADCTSAQPQVACASGARREEEAAHRRRVCYSSQKFMRWNTASAGRRQMRQRRACKADQPKIE